MPGRGVNIALDDPGASRAGSGDWALACGAAINAMPAVGIRDTSRVRNMGCFLVTPYKNVCMVRSLQAAGWRGVSFCQVRTSRHIRSAPQNRSGDLCLKAAEVLGRM